MSTKGQRPTRATTAKPQKKRLNDVNPTPKEIQNSLKYLQGLDQKKKLSKVADGCRCYSENIEVV